MCNLSHWPGKYTVYWLQLVPLNAQPDGGCRCGASVRFSRSLQSGDHLLDIFQTCKPIATSPHDLNVFILAYPCGCGCRWMPISRWSARAQPQINPLRTTENPHPVTTTGLLGTGASLTAWKALLSSRCSWHRRAHFWVCSWLFYCIFENITVGWGTSWLIDYE